MEIKNITKADLFADKYSKLVKGRNPIEFRRPTFAEANKMSKRELCIYIGLFGLRLRPIDSSLDNANYWLKNKTKEEILNTFENEFIHQD